MSIVSYVWCYTNSTKDVINSELSQAGRDREQILAIQMGKAFQFDGVVILYSLLLRPYHEPSFPYQALRNY